MKNSSRTWGIVLTILIGLVPNLSLGASGASEERVTQLSMTEQPRVYIAPGNESAKIKVFKIPFKEVAIPGTGRVLRSWTFNVYNASGLIVYTQTKFEQSDRGFFGELLNIGEKPSVEIPSELEWKGQIDVPGRPDNGQLVPDGNYTYLISVVDDKGERAITPPFNITVRNAPIYIEYVRIPLPIFNPIGKRNSVLIEQYGSRETRWEGIIKDERGKVVRKFLWENETNFQASDLRPSNFTWDGKDDSGELVPEGKYFYTLSGQNRPGAEANLTSEIPIVLNMKSGNVLIGTSQEVISPNGDGINDAISINTHIDEKEGLLDWTMSISLLTNPNLVLWSKSGRGEIPTTVVFDGKTQDGRTLGNGNYEIKLRASYDNGNTIDSLPAHFECNLVSPTIELTADQTVFGGETKQTVKLTLSKGASIDWELSIVDKMGKQVFSKGISSPELETIVWDGKGNAGNVVIDDVYTVLVKGRNKAGNLGQASLTIRKDTRSMKGSIELSQSTINQNRTGMNSVRITPILEALDSIENIQFGIFDESGQIIAVKKSQNLIPFWDWFGKADSGKQLKDGDYKVSLIVNYINGSLVRAESSLHLDSKIPEIKLTLEPQTYAFSPALTPVTFKLSVSPKLEIKEWKFSLQHRSSASQFAQSGTQTLPDKLVWDGKTNEKTTIDGLYDGKLVVYFANGLKSEIQTSKPITVSTSGPQFDLRLSSNTFVPGNLDGPKDLEVVLNAQKNEVPVTKWKIQIRNEENEVVKELEGDSLATAKFIWDGSLSNGKMVMSGEEYTISARLTNSLGLESEKKARVIIDILVVQLADGSYKIVVNSIQFPGYSSDLFDVENLLFDKNIFTLRRLTAVLNKFPKYKIKLEGYAVSEYWRDAKQAEWEQKTELLPLSKKRATAVMKVLVLLGVERERFTVAGYGSDNPIVPHSDLQNRWQNRRVEFYLQQ